MVCHVSRSGYCSKSANLKVFTLENEHQPRLKSNKAPPVRVAERSYIGAPSIACEIGGKKRHKIATISHHDLKVLRDGWYLLQHASAVRYETLVGCQSQGTRAGFDPDIRSRTIWFE